MERYSEWVLWHEDDVVQQNKGLVFETNSLLFSCGADGQQQIRNEISKDNRPHAFRYTQCKNWKREGFAPPR